MKDKTLCSIKGCKNAAHATGLCQNHYRLKRKKNMKTTCKVKGCKKVVFSSEMCQKHYYQKWLKIPENREKHRKGNNVFRAKPENKKKIRTWGREQTAKRHIVLTMLKSNGCAICGYNECPACLDFHHVNIKDKCFDIGVNKMGNNAEKLADELDKCILLCCRCHRKLHFETGGNRK